MTSWRGATTRPTSKRCGDSPRPVRPRAAGIGIGGDDPAFRGHARGRGDGGRRIAPGGGGDPAWRCRACLPSRGRAPSRDAGPRLRLLHLRRPGAGDRPGATRRPARPVRRPRRPPRRRRPGDLLGRPGRPDTSRSTRPAATCSRGVATSTSSGRGPRPGRRSTCRWSPTPARVPGSGACERLLPELAAAFGPDLIVSQHGADSHAWDPLAHLRVTTTAMGEAARLVDAIAHRYAGGRWLATGGGGYDAYRVVPRMWSLVWLAGAHREVPAANPRRMAQDLVPRWRPLRPGAAAGDLHRCPNAGSRVDTPSRRLRRCRGDGLGGPARPGASAAARGTGSRLVGPDGWAAGAGTADAGTGTAAPAISGPWRPFGARAPASTRSDAVARGRASSGRPRPAADRASDAHVSAAGRRRLGDRRRRGPVGRGSRPIAHCWRSALLRIDAAGAWPQPCSPPPRPWSPRSPSRNATRVDPLDRMAVGRARAVRAGRLRRLARGGRRPPHRPVGDRGDPASVEARS